MRLLCAALAAVCLAGAGCGGAASTRRSADDVAALIRRTWGTTKGSPSFDYTCESLDDRGRLFSCLARDPTDTVRLASFDVVCDASACRWTD